MQNLRGLGAFKASLEPLRVAMSSGYFTQRL
jgi:hypothetical protein